MKSKATRTKVPAKRAAAKKKVQPIPAGYSAVTPYLSVRGAAQAIVFYKKAFGAKEIMRMPLSDELGLKGALAGGGRLPKVSPQEVMAPEMRDKIFVFATNEHPQFLTKIYASDPKGPFASRFDLA